MQIPVRLNITRDDLPLVTLSLAAACVLVFGMELALSEFWRKVIFEVVSYGPRNFYNPGAPLLSIAFHAGFLVLGFNVLFLLLFGAQVEPRAGIYKFLLVFLVAGLLGSVLEMLMRFLSLGPEGIGAIGASGAVSGIIALYAYRLWYPRERLLMEPGLVSFGAEVPAAPFIVLWFLKDLVLGTPVFDGYAVSAGHWAQAGGFAAGLGLGFLTGFGHEGSRIETLRKLAMERFEKSGGWGITVTALQKIREIAPGDPLVNRDLARLHAKQRKKKEAMLYYRHAVEAFIKEDPTAAASLIFEHVNALKAPMSIQVHHRAARALVDIGMKDEARQLMLAALRRKAENTPPYENAIVFYIMLLIDLGEMKEAKRSYGIFKQRFPKSEKAAEILDASKKAPGTIFLLGSQDTPDKKEGPAPARPQEAAGEQAPAKGKSRAWLIATEILADPWFMPAWFGLYLAALVLEASGKLPGRAVAGFTGLGWQSLVLGLAVYITSERKHRLLRGVLARRRERKAREEQEYRDSLALAKKAEAGGEFGEAAGHYERYLERFGDDIEARVSLARLYHKGLGNTESALEHYEEVLEGAEPGTPLHEEAREAVSALGEGAGGEAVDKEQQEESGG